MLLNKYQLRICCILYIISPSRNTYSLFLMSRYHLPFTPSCHSVQGGCVSLGLGVYTPWTHNPPGQPPLQSTSRWYTSYWNAFLFVYYFCLSCFMCLRLTPSCQFSWWRSTCEVLGATGRYGDLWPMWCVTFKQSASLITLKVADEFAFAPLLLTYRYLLIIKLH